MVENTAHTEAHDAVAGIAIDNGYRMASRLPRRRNAMTGITGYTQPDHVGAGVIGVGTQETGGRMTVATFGGGVRVGGRGRLTPGHDAIVTTRA